MMSYFNSSIGLCAVAVCRDPRLAGTDHISCIDMDLLDATGSGWLY